MFNLNELINVVSSLGTYDGLSTEMTSNSVSTQLIDDLSITKTADREAWVNGDLTYTITIENQSTTTPYVSPTVTDTIDPALATLVANSVTINGQPATSPDDYTFDAGTGLLTVFLDDVNPETSTIIVFKVSRV